MSNCCFYSSSFVLTSEFGVVKNAGKAQRFHFEVGHTVLVALSQEALLFFKGVFAEGSVDTRLALVEVVATHGLSAYDVEQDVVVGVIS